MNLFPRLRNQLQLFASRILAFIKGARPAPALAGFEQLKYPYSVNYAQLQQDNLRIAYIDEGQGPYTLIFVHGMGSYLPAWKRNLAELSQHYRCVALDLPGYGQSSKGYLPLTMPYLTQAMVQFVQALGIGQAVWVGHSLGGQLLLQLAISHPTLVQALVLINSAGFETFSPAQRHLLKASLTPAYVAQLDEDSIRRNLSMNFYHTPPAAEFMVKDRMAMRTMHGFKEYCHVVAASVQAMLDGPVYDNLAQVSCPTLLVVGERDALIPNKLLNPHLTTRHVAQDAARRISQSKLVMVPNAGHFSMFEQPDAVNTAIEEFLDALPLPAIAAQVKEAPGI